MRLLMFTQSLGAGGAERVTVMLANFWADRGWRVSVLTVEDADADFYTLDRRIERISLNLAGPSGSRFAALVQNFRRLRGLRQVLRRVQPDAAVALMTAPSCQLALAGQGMGVVLLGSERVHPPTYDLDPFWRFARRHAYALLDAVVAQTEQSRDWLLGHTRAGRCEVIANPVQVPVPVPDHAPRIPPGDCVRGGEHLLLAAGRLTPQKGFDLLIEAFAGLVPEFPTWRLVILGEGPEREKLHRRIGDLALEGRVSLPGLAGNMAEWHAAADLFVLSSRFEGFPNALLEALAAGVPAVATDCATGPREILRDGVDGALVPPEDVEALTAGLRALMASEAMRDAAGRSAAENTARFALAPIAGQWEALIEQLRAER